MNKSGQMFDSVWDAIEDTPEDAADMKVRASFLIALTRHIQNQRWTHEEAAARLDIPATRLNDLTNDRIWNFGQDELAELCRRAGCSLGPSGRDDLPPGEAEALHRQT